MEIIIVPIVIISSDKRDAGLSIDVMDKTTWIKHEDNFKNEVRQCGESNLKVTLKRKNLEDERKEQSAIEDLLDLFCLRRADHAQTFWSAVRLGEGVVWTRRRQGGERRRLLVRRRARGRRFGVRGRGCGEKERDEEKGGPHRRRRGGDEIPPRLPRFNRSVFPYGATIDHVKKR
ncbi:hypothetical protein QVD17_03959 [Tagetes erecta]|uniref:Uncharacterized protein n=1 Tax=Tagetes erecta TaxID=13708 RepID=A0AAD8LFD7_TARER|nr:hypothetical protein QVD17_03959 [Tagetes erecta]